MIRVDDLERAFPDAQAGGTRLVLTQSTYLVQKLVDLLDEGDRIVATADRATGLGLRVPRVLRGAELWQSGKFAGARVHRDRPHRAPASLPGRVASAPQSPSPWLALGSACRETRDAFQRAADLMPTFSAAFSNLGATLGELDEPEAALNAFRQALAHDPRSFTILNNVGVVCRELGRLDESEAAFRRVIEVHPEFVFVYRNLGHTLFLAGKYRDALGAFRRGAAARSEQNRRQGCRLAVMRFANADAAGAERDLWRFANAAPPGEREDLMLEAYEIAHALLTQDPALAPHRPFLDRIGAEITKSE